MKATYEQKLELAKKIAEGTIEGLLSIIRNYSDENQIADVLYELEDLKDNTYYQDLIGEVITTLSGENKVCPLCHKRLIPTVHFEKHNEIDGNFHEEFVSYSCDECGFDDSDC